MPKYTVKSPVKLVDGIHPEGKFIEVDEETAAELIALGALEVVAQPDPTARLAELVEAIGDLDQEVASNWMNDGRPNIAVLTPHLGWKPTAAERDTAYATWKSNQESQG